jgi:hypothetical protein
MKQPVVVKPLDLVVDAARLGEQGFSAQSEDPTGQSPHAPRLVVETLLVRDLGLIGREGWALGIRTQRLHAFRL